MSPVFVRHHRSVPIDKEVYSYKLKTTTDSALEINPSPHAVLLRS